MDSDVDSDSRSIDSPSTPQPPPGTPQQPQQQQKQQMDPAARKQALEAFKEFLKEKGISANASWEHTLKLIGNEPRYISTFKQLNEKKQAFNAYKVQKQKEDKEEERRRNKKNKEDLEKFLMTCEHMNSTIKYKWDLNDFLSDK